MTLQNNNIPILSDYGFKVTFGNPNSHLFLKKALTALIQAKEPIKKIQILNNESVGLTASSRAALLDLHCEDEKGNAFIVEMQLGKMKNFIQRANFYALQRLDTIVKKGKYNFDDLSKIYCISLLNFALYPNLEDHYHFATLKNQHGVELYNQITHIIVEMPKFKRALNHIQTDLDKLIYFMNNSDHSTSSDSTPEFYKEDWIAEAIKQLDEGNLTPEQRYWLVTGVAKAVSDRRAAKEEGKEEGREEGREEGIQEGMQKGIQKGIDQGELKEKSNIAKRLKDKGMDIEFIVEVTGLTAEEIEKL